MTDRILSSLPVAIAILSGRGIVRWASAPLGVLLGERLEGLVGQELGTHGGMARLLEGCGISLAQAMELGRSRTEPLFWSEVPWAPEGAPPRRHDITLARLEAETPAGEEPLFLIMLVDATARVRARELDEQARRFDGLTRLAEVVAGVAHEMGNPVCIISGNTQYLLSMLSSRPQHALSTAEWSDVLDSMRAIEKASKRCANLVTSLVSLAPQQGPSAGLVRDQVDLNRLLEKLVRLCESEFAAQGIRVSKNLADPSPVVEGDPWQVRQALLNVVQRAQRAMPGGGLLSLATLCVGAWAAIVVGDSGTTSSLARAEPDGPATSGSVSQRVDLDLSMARLLLAQNGGTMQVEAGAAAGTTITLKIPLAGRTASPGHPSDAIARGG